MEVRRPGRDVDQSPPTSAVIKHDQTYASDRFMPSWSGQTQLNVLIIYVIMCDWSEICATEEYTIAKCTT